MIKSLLTGAGLVMIVAVVAWISGDMSLLSRWLGYLGFGCWILAFIYSGSLVSGSEIRRSYVAEDKED